MANTDHNPVLLDQVQVQLEAPLQPSSGALSPSEQPEASPQPPATAPAKDLSSSPADSRPNAAPARPTLVQLGSATSQPLQHHPPKKFNAVNINKKFLEQTSAAAALATASAASAANKSNSTISRSQSQATQAHSRLVTAKLTGSPVPPTTAGPGWSRPTSTAPSSTGENSPIGSSPLPSAAVALAANAAPQLPHVGKVIQPQPRAAINQTTNLQKDGIKASGRSVWGSVKPPSVAPIMTSQDFPTAAEVAQATATRKQKEEDDQKSTLESASAVKHRLEEEADTFRGVHLDPNAEHWDEMEEDNDDFLGGVIEFGDGRQYKVEATEPPAPDEPVRKEDRFVDDFDRSWPKSKPSPTSSTREFAAASPALSSRGASLHGAQDYSHPHLFNERSNRLEPYSSSHGPRSGQSTYQGRRGSHNDGSTSPVESRKGSVSFLQKSGGNGEIPSSRPPRGGINGAPPPPRGAPGPIGGDRSRRDHPPSPRTSRNDWGHHHHDMAPSTSLQGRDRDSERGRSDMGPPPIPLHARRLSQDSNSGGGRQLPPHLSPSLPLPRRLPSHDPDRDRDHSQDGTGPSRFGPAAPSSIGPTSPQQSSSRFALPPASPALSHTSNSLSLAALSPGSSIVALPGGATADLNEVTKDLMQSAAARAKARKQQDEAEREAQKERARKKAAELEEKMKEREAEKEREEMEERQRREREERQREEDSKERTQAKEREKEAVAFIESAIDGVKTPVSQVRRASVDTTQNLPRRPPSQRGQQRRDSGPPGAGVGPAGRRASFGIGPRVTPPSADPSPASQVESWRAKAGPLPPRHHAPQPRPRSSSVVAPEPQQQQQPPATTLVGAPSALDHVVDIAEGSMTDLEVVDFSNMGQFVGGEEKENDEEQGSARESEKKTEDSEVPNKLRPTASDFFEENSTSVPPQVAENVWRRKTSASASVVVAVAEGEEKKEKVVKEEEIDTLRASSSAPVVTTATASPPHSHPRLRPHAEASMSALDDVMSRIKGAIDGMQATGATAKEHKPPLATAETEGHPSHYHEHRHNHHHMTPRNSYPIPSSATSKPHRERWQPAPPHLSPQGHQYQHIQQQQQQQQQQQRAAEERLEALREPLSTSTDLGYTPHLPSSTSLPSLPVTLPKTSHRIEPISKKQQYSFSRPPVPARLDFLSFEPPVQGMTKRDFTVNSVLFRPPPGNGYKANRIRVSLPVPPGAKHHHGPRTVSVAAKYSTGNNVGGFGKGTNADEASSWRKAVAPQKPSEDGEKDKKSVTGVAEEDGSAASKESGSEKPQDETPSSQATRTTRQQPKMPAGSVVAFFRDSRIDAVEADPKPLVNFIVTSELDNLEPVVEVFSAVSSSSEAGEKSGLKKTAMKDAGAGGNKVTVDGGVKVIGAENSSQSASSPSTASSVVKFKAPEARGTEESITTRSISAPSPSHQSTSTSTPWGRSSLSVPLKDGAVRAPDPEHLKAVWSQPNKADLNPVNSLEGIADDLTSVPFSIQDVKSEDGETPPPALPPTTSRMSLHEVTKAFQKVPSSSPSSSSSQSRNPISPPSNNHTPAATTRSSYPYSPMPPNAMRLPHSYEQHYSPMLSHSPSPTVIYPHQLTSSPVPGRMAVNGHGHAPMYQAPVWISQPPPTSTPGNHGAVMRPVMSPYMMPYGTPSYGHPMGAMPAPASQPPVGTAGAAAGRGRGVPMMSPAMSHAHAHAAATMYGSPVMMHMQPVPSHQNHGAYMGLPHQPQMGNGTPGRGQQQRTDMSQGHHPSQAAANASGQQPQQHNHHPSTYNPQTSFIRSTW